MLWGPSIKLVKRKYQIQEQLKKIQNTGVKMSACIVCVEDYEATSILTDLNIEVTHTLGELLTLCLKRGILGCYDYLIFFYNIFY